MNKSVGLNKIIEYLENEKERYLQAWASGNFCDGNKCLHIASCISMALMEIENARIFYRV